MLFLIWNNFLAELLSSWPETLRKMIICSRERNSGKNEKDHSQVGLEVEVGGVESVLSATVVEIERNQGRIANPGPKVIVVPLSLISSSFLFCH